MGAIWTLADTVAAWIGYVVMMACGVTSAAALIAVSCNYLWRKLRDAQGLAWLQRAVKAHRKVEPWPGNPEEPLS